MLFAASGGAPARAKTAPTRSVYVRGFLGICTAHWATETPQVCAWSGEDGVATPRPCDSSRAIAEEAVQVKSKRTFTLTISKFACV
jgi:hypothetical protein